MCDPFWTFPLNTPECPGGNGQADVLVHEVSHLYGTLDTVYGVDGSLALNHDQAMHNADNYRYYARSELFSVRFARRRMLMGFRYCLLNYVYVYVYGLMGSSVKGNRSGIWSLHTRGMYSRRSGGKSQVSFRFTGKTGLVRPARCLTGRDHLPLSHRIYDLGRTGPPSR